MYRRCCRSAVHLSEWRSPSQLETNPSLITAFDSAVVAVKAVPAVINIRSDLSEQEG